MSIVLNIVFEEKEYQLIEDSNLVPPIGSKITFSTNKPYDEYEEEMDEFIPTLKRPKMTTMFENLVVEDIRIHYEEIGKKCPTDPFYRLDKYVYLICKKSEEKV